MTIRTHFEQKSVPHLLGLLASAIGESEKRADPCCRDTTPKTLVGTVSRFPNNDRREPGECSGLNIRGLKRTYNILLFGGPSHEEIIEQAALEDECITSRCDKLSLEEAAAIPDGHSIMSVVSNHNDTLSSILASISAASFELRRERRFDAANALEGMIDHLALRHGQQGAASIDNLLKLFTKLRRYRPQSRDVDDWEIIGPCGRRVLQRLYNSNECDSATGEGVLCWADDRYFRTPRRAWRTTIARQPIASFFRYSHIGDCERRLGYTGIPVGLVPEENGENLVDTQPPSSMLTPAPNRFFLPNDCVLHEDSAIAQSSASTSLFTAYFGVAENVYPGYERIPWFTASEFSSERGVPDLGQRSALNGYLETVAAAPLSPSGWTTNGLQGGAGVTLAASSSTTFSSGGGPPAVPAMVESTAGFLEGKEATVRGDKGAGRRYGEVTGHGHDLDLFGALCRAHVDTRSSAVRELRVPLSFPDLEDDCAPDLLKAAQTRLVGPTHPMSCETSDGKQNDLDQPARFRHAPTGGTRVDLLLNGSRQPDRVPALQYGWPKNVPVRGIGPAWNSVGSDVEDDSVSRSISEERGLHPVGWEQAEANWNDPLVPKWALEAPPLLTGNGGPGREAFELCYREHYDVRVRPEEDLLATMDEAVMVHRVLAALQGLPSVSFRRDAERACMRVSGLRRGLESQRPSAEEAWGEDVLQRVPGLSHDAFSSLLEEFAFAGTWYYRVEEFATRLSDRSAAVAQVAQAFGIELRRQLTILQDEILVVSAELTRSDRVAAKRADDDGSTCQWACRINDEKHFAAATSCTLTGVLIRTIEVRRALRGLAEICGLAGEELENEKGVGGLVEAFPRGAPLLTYLYRTAETRAASRPGVGCGHERQTVMGERESALALLKSAAAPYLEMLRRWIWSGELWEEDDTFGEFLLRCRAPGGGCDDGWREKEPWMEDGGSSFMSLAFCENKAAGAPCFLEGGVLVVAARAGKLLRMLKLSSREFYEACAVSPPPALTLIFGSDALKSREEVFSRVSLLRDVAVRSAALAIRTRATGDDRKARSQRGTEGDRLLVEDKNLGTRIRESWLNEDDESAENVRRLRSDGLYTDRAAAASASAAAAISSETASPVASGGGGILSFLDSPTSREEAFAAEALRERYRLLGVEADVRAARARWRRERSERLDEKRASLRILYAMEENEWKAMVAATRTFGGTVDDGKNGAGGNMARCGDEGTAQDEAMAEDRWMEVKAADADMEETIVKKTGRGVPLGPTGTSAIESLRGEKSSRLSPASAGIAPNSSRKAGGAQGQESASKSSVDSGESSWPRAADYQFGFRDEHLDEIKFSPVTIVQEPGGSSTGVADALGNWGGIALGGSSAIAKEPLLKFSHVKIVEEPGGSSSAMARALGAEHVDGGDAGRPASCNSTMTSRSRPAGKGVGPSPMSGSCSSDYFDEGRVGADNKRRSFKRRDANAQGAGDDIEVRESRTESSEGSRESLTVVSLPAAAAEMIGDREKVRKVRSQGEKITRYRTPSDSFPIGVTAEEAIGEAGVVNYGERVLVRAPGEVLASTHIPAKERQSILARASQSVPAWSHSTRADVNAAHDRDSRGNDLSPTFSPSTEEHQDVGDALEFDSPLPLEVLVRRCVREPVLAQCRAVDLAALAFLVRGAGVAEHLASLRSFLLGHGSDFLHDITLRLLEGLFDGCVDWRRQSNLDTAFAASALATGLSSNPLAEALRYEVDVTVVETDGGKPIGTPRSLVDAALDRYSPIALSFVSPILVVPWPVGVLLPKGALHIYSSIHRCLFRHQLLMHRLRRLRLSLRELDALMNASMRRRNKAVAEPDGRVREDALLAWDRGRLHWMHLFRHEMHHMADSLQTFFMERTEAGWSDLFRSLSVAEASESSPLTAKDGGGSLAGLAVAHSRYITNMHAHMFLGPDRPGAKARAAIQGFYEVLCTVGRVTDGLLRGSCGSFSPRDTPSKSDRENREAMLVPDAAFTDLASSRVKFDASRRDLYGALVEMCAAGGGDRARPLLTILGYDAHTSGGGVAAQRRSSLGS